MTSTTHLRLVVSSTFLFVALPALAQTGTISGKVDVTPAKYAEDTVGSFKTNEERTHKFDQEGGYSQLCSIHPEMLGYVFVAPSRLAVAVDAKGHYTIKDVPPGSYKLGVWNAKLDGLWENSPLQANDVTGVSWR